MPVKSDAFGAGAPAETEPSAEPKQRRRRRTKEQIEADNIAKAKIPNDDDEVMVVFSQTVDSFEAGSTHNLLWPDALRLAREGKVTLSDKHELARKRLDQEEKSKLDAEDASFQGKPRTPELDEQIKVRIAGTEFDWAWREVVKHVVWNKNDNLECVDPENAAALARVKAAYDAEHGDAGPASLSGKAPSDDEIKEQLESDPPASQAALPPAAAPTPAPAPAETDNAVSNEEGDVTVETEGTPIAEQVSPGVWKVGMGFIEKIGLPDYSSLAIGPTTASTYVVDDGRRQTYEMKERGTGLPVSVDLPQAVVEKLTEASNICEVVMRAQRQSMINFLEAVKGPQAAPPPAS